MMGKKDHTLCSSHCPIVLIIFVYFFLCIMYNFIYVLLAGASAEEIVCEGYKKIWPM